jgi:cyclase
MLRPRIIPCLLLHNNGLVKTVQFKNPKYVGDPINTVRIFNEKEVDELMIIDIDASVKNIEPDYKLIEKLARECRMPLCYGGGVKTLEQANKIFTLGVEKIAISSVVLSNPEIVTAIADRVGSQSVVVVLDIKKTSEGYEIYTHNGIKSTRKNAIELASEMQRLGAGEIVINAIDQDGMMNGYDFELIRTIRKIIHIPLTVLGGAGTLTDISDLIKEHGIIGASAGSLFVFKGIYRAVLINYPNYEEKENIYKLTSKTVN